MAPQRKTRTPSLSIYKERIQIVSSAGKPCFYRNLLSLDNSGIISQSVLFVKRFFKKTFLFFRGGIGNGTGNPANPRSRHNMRDKKRKSPQKNGGETFLFFSVFQRLKRSVGTCGKWSDFRIKPSFNLFYGFSKCVPQSRSAAPEAIPAR